MSKRKPKVDVEGQFVPNDTETLFEFSMVFFDVFFCLLECFCLIPSFDLVRRCFSLVLCAFQLAFHLRKDRELLILAS